jgi:zinc-ribbon family
VAVRYDAARGFPRSGSEGAGTVIIFGLSVFFFGKVAEGMFHCPNCGGDRHYKQKIGRRWFTLFFLPVIPLGKVAEVVQCSTCNTRYNLSVLRVPTTSQLAAGYSAAVSAAVSLALRAGDAASSPARARAVDAVRLAGATGFGEAELDAELAQPVPAVQQRLAAAGGMLSPEARERVLGEAVRVALADAPLTTGGRNALAAAGQALNLTAAQFHGVIAMVEQAARP